MALIGNKSIHHKSPLYYMGKEQAFDLANAAGQGRASARFFGGFNQISGGYVSGCSGRPCFKMPMKPGGLSSFTSVYGIGTLVVAVAAGYGIAGEAAGSSVAEAAGVMIVPFAGESDGIATVSGAASSLVGAVGVSDGSSTAVALTGAFNWCVGSAVGLATLSAVLTAIGKLGGEITPFTDLSPEGLARAVWNANAASVDNVGTTGGKLNEIGGVSSGGLTTEEHDLLVNTAKKGDLAPLL